MLTKRLRQIPNARHSQFKLVFVFMVQRFKLSGSVAHYLTRRHTSSLAKLTYLQAKQKHQPAIALNR